MGQHETKLIQPFKLLLLLHLPFFFALPHYLLADP